MVTTLFYFTTLKMKSVTTITTLFYFTTTNPRDHTTVTTLLLSLIDQIVFPQEFQCFHKICMCHSNFTVRSLAESYMIYYPVIWLSNIYLIDLNSLFCVILLYDKIKVLGTVIVESSKPVRPGMFQKN